MGLKNKSAKAKSASRSSARSKVVSIVHEDAKRKNIPTAEYQSIMQKTDLTPVQVSIDRRNRDLDPQLMWRGKDQQDQTDLSVSAPPLYIQEKVHPKVLIDDLIRHSNKVEAEEEEQIDLFSDFNGLPSEGAKTEFYQHDSHWSNRMILGDSLQVMSSLSEREGLRGKVQCIYLDPPYGIKFNSNFQWSTNDNKVTDGKMDHITREPEQVKAFRDTWRDGIHTYLTYLRDRLAVARDLLTDSGSIFVQIGDENVHRVRALMDEVFGEENFIQLIPFRKKLMPLGSATLEGMTDYLVFYCKNRASMKYRVLYKKAFPKAESRWTGFENADGSRTRVNSADIAKLESVDRVYRLVSQRAPSYSDQTTYNYSFNGKVFPAPKGGSWVTTEEKMKRLERANRLEVEGKSLSYVYYFNDFPYQKLNNMWDDTAPAQNKTYVVQTNQDVIQRCILMTTDPGDLVLDPTCGSGTTAYVAEQWGRRWITIDTSRVALALARARIMGARYPYYLLADSPEGLRKEAEIKMSVPSERQTFGDIRQGFVYERAPHVTLKEIANNSEIDVIWDRWAKTIEGHLLELNKALKTKWQDFDVPRQPEANWSKTASAAHEQFWKSRAKRQAEIDASIVAHADSEFLRDKPYVDKGKIRVPGPFTVESVSPHRVVGLDADDNLMRESRSSSPEFAAVQDFTAAILENLKNAGVQQVHKDDKIEFTSISPWPGKMVCAEGFFIEKKSGKEKRAAILVGPEFGTVSRPDLAEAAKEAGDSDFDVLISCAFNYDARSSDFASLGRLPILKARMNADLHMAGELKNTGKGNLFVVFGEPDIEIAKQKGALFTVKINGVDVFHPNTGEVKSDGADGIACWFIDTDYNEESFFVRHAYFLGATDPYKALRAALKADINEIAWESLRSDVSRPFSAPNSGRIAVKVINHLGDEVMKVFKVG